jgi:hypothetical protein
MMNSFTILRQHLSDPEYLHTLINPVPVYGLAVGVLALTLALIFRNQRVTIAALILVFVTALSAWPTYHYGEAAYDRVKAMSDPAGEQWLDEHMARGEKMIWLFYVLAGVAAIGAGAVLKWPRTLFAITLGTLVLGGTTLGTGGYIAYAGGHVRHKEFRFEPPPQARADEHQHGAEQKAAAPPAEHAGHEQMPQQPSAGQPKSEEERRQLEASRLQLEASRLQLEASQKQLETAGGASPSPTASASPGASPTPQPSPEQHKHDEHQHDEHKP